MLNRYKHHVCRHRKCRRWCLQSDVWNIENGNHLASVEYSLPDTGVATNEVWAVGNSMATIIRILDDQGRVSFNNGMHFTYDDDGNLLSDGVYAFAYDSFGRLKTVSSNGVLLVTNHYDTRFRRVKKVTPEATTTFFYDDWNLIEERIEYENGTTTTIKYYWGKDLSGSLQGAGGVGGLLYLTVSNSNSQLELYIPCYDNNGNITKYIDANGGVVASYTYDAFGKLIAKSGPLADFFRHRFSTKYFDAESNLYYYGYRFYHSILMRWLNRDPIEENGGLNLYGFCGNGAIFKYDKDGRAYFAVRGLGSLKNPIIFGGHFTFLNDWLDQKNLQPLHEQLFFQDGKSLTSIGYGKENLDNEPMTGYVITSGGYDDCTMRIAVEKVNPQPYSLLGSVFRSKYNCQDYASQLKAKYFEIKDSDEVRCRCKKGR